MNSSDQVDAAATRGVRSVFLERAPFYLTCASAVSILFSIAVSQILLALAFAALLLSGVRIRLPPIKLPLALFVAGTILAVLLSGDPRAGTPQIRKFFVFLILILIYSTYRNLAEIRATVLLWAAVASIAGVNSFLQFFHKYEQARELHRNFYDYYVAERITGFTSHWMTFGGEEMVVLLMLIAFLMFSPRADRKWKVIGGICCAILAVSLVLGFTRSIFLLGVPVGFVYLLYAWKRWLVLLIPVAVVVVLLVSPGFVRERVLSIVRPHGQTDSNLHREITRRTGWAMVRAHPWLGIGPEEIKPHFDEYVPADVTRPLPDGWYGHLHNIYLQYAAERGVPTMLILMWLIAQVIYDFGSTLARHAVRPEARFVLHGAIAVILAILAEGFLEYNLGDSEVLTLFLSVIAFGYVARESAPIHA